MTSVGFYNDQIVSFVNGWKFSGAVRTDCCDLCVWAMPSDRINDGGDLWIFFSVGFFIQNGTTLTRIRFHSIVDHALGVSNSIATSSCVVPLLAR